MFEQFKNYVKYCKLLLISVIKRVVIIIIIFSVGINIALLTSEPNNDKMILDIADDSYFVGCMEAINDTPTCHGRSKQYRREFSEHTGL